TVEPLAEKFEACGWHVVNVDGHDYEDLFKAFKNYDSCEENKPFAIIARTIKGKGISFMENSLNWHHGVPKGELLNVAKESLMNHVN
ncbi:MAG: transketolase, partial [Candidatus Omnitrophica bacterium]|nr:transketolase [Candidatus Omnitrophota bacterium]